MVTITRTELRRRFERRSRRADRWELAALFVGFGTLLALIPWWESVTARVAAGWTQLVVALLLGVVARGARRPRCRLGAKLIVVLALCVAAALLLDVGGEAGRRALLGGVLLASGSVWLWGVRGARREQAFFGVSIGVVWIVCALMVLSTFFVESLDAEETTRLLKQVLAMQLVWAMQTLSQVLFDER